MIRIGVVNIDVSHPKSFAAVLEKEERARYVAVYNDGFRGDDEVDSFVKNAGLEKRCDSVEELAEMVDVGFIQGCNWDKHLAYAEPFFKRNKPVFIDKPIVGNLADCKKLDELTAAGKIILGSSSARYAPEIVEFLAIPEEERGTILNVYGTAGVDEFNYAIHIVEIIGGLLGTGAQSTQFVGKSSIDNKICETFTVTYPQCTATYSTFQGVWMPFHLVIMTTKGTYHIQIDTSKIYSALLERICTFMEGGSNELADMTELTESIKIMLAGKLSRERDGEKVTLSEIPENDPGYNGDQFEEEYGAAAAKIYLKW